MAEPARLLLIEDDDSIGQAVRTALRSVGHVVEWGRDGHGLTDRLQRFRPDLVLLDVMLPGRDGFTLAGEVRAHSDAGIVVLTARDQIDDRLRGFDVGADDYVAKPFVMAELLARLTAVLRRMGRVPATVQVGDLVLDEAASVVTRSGRVLELTATELRLLAFLVAQRGRTVSKTQILTQVWGYEAYDPNVVEVHVSALRRKMEAHGPRMLHTVRGVGYRLTAGG